MISRSTIRPSPGGPSAAAPRQPARALPRGRLVSRGGAGRRDAAFTLAEILIVIALILVLGTLAVTNFDTITNGMGKKPVEEILHDTIREARFQALTNHRNVFIGYDDDKGVFFITDYLTQNRVEEIPTQVDPKTTKIELTFDPIVPLNDVSTPIDSPPSFANITTDTLIFHASGATAPVKVILKVDDKDHSFLLDPFSEGPPPKPPTP